MGNIKNNVQKFGKFLSGMVMPNIGAFIAWGIITAFFIPSGWIPNETLGNLVDPMLKYLLPLLIGYTGGRVVGGDRGGVIGAISTSGVIVGSDIPMFIGAMVVGPISGFVIKKFDKYVEDKIPSGFEMLVNNFSVGILGVILAILSFLFIGPVITTLTGFLSIGVYTIINKGLLPFVSIFVEPAKILFLNNAINHGILGPIGLNQVQETGKSILFLLESNPGPGLGVILAYFIFSKGMVKQSAAGSAIIHLFGGIHEIYFPYILMNPMLILSVILGGFSGVLVFSLFSVGLVATPSPGSIFSILFLAAKGDALKILLGIIVSTIVSFVVSGFFIKRTSEEDLNKAKSGVGELKSNLNLQEYKAIDFSNINKIVFSCDAGMGSSAMGASKFRNRLKKEGIKIDVEYSSVDNIPRDTQIVVTHENLKDRVLNTNKNINVIGIQNFLNDPNIENLFKNILESGTKNEKFGNDPLNKENNKNQYDIFNENNIILNASVDTKEEAIEIVGRLLVKNGYVKEEYVSGMLRRESLVSTYIGMGVAIPHGENDVKSSIIRSGIVFMQVKDGVLFGDEKAYLIVGIAGVGDDHIRILSNLAEIIGDEENLKRLKESNNKKEILDIILRE
ncbi:PTS mannitol transporter subunit IICBA [Candidatus Arthromitus sp. SFB-rat-Yit]|uniref:PTS mannitol transporter subunit IICBA n=1 Tax=Candidatus Arthromitus sp. SFB-rat-Yit TaxID=1041504 RepID=UPI000227A043|nr:PTS mannitol transporter subunit IICBA [Candidatus Arthromitus sp. SFB-rat-Yit]BAK80711.1 PTS system mannitol-specific transporter subunit IIC [Candidatus Arthromitus sp. SFB-rat-Yit]